MALASKPFLVSSHARERMKERDIDPSWIDTVVRHAKEMSPQEGRETRWRLWHNIPERGDRALCVVLDEHVDHLEIVTVFFDRRKRR